MQYKFRLPIGDWSNDGHGRCEYFTVLSNKDVDKVREFHFKAMQIFDLRDIFAQYQENYIDEEILKTIPVYIKEKLILDDEGCFKGVYNERKVARRLAEVWVNLLERAGEGELSLELLSDEYIPLLSFVSVGYGLFEDE